MGQLSGFQQGADDQIPLIAHNLGQVSNEQLLIADSLVNTDDQPWIEYLAPYSHRAEKAGAITWSVGDPLLKFMQELQQTNEPVRDSYLGNLPAEMHRSVYAGLLFHLASVAKEQGKTEVSREAVDAAKNLLASPVERDTQ